MFFFTLVLLVSDETCERTVTFVLFLELPLVDPVLELLEVISTVVFSLSERIELCDVPFSGTGIDSPLTVT